MNEKEMAALAAAREANKGKPRAPKPSKKAAIYAKCKDCIYDENDEGTWRKQVERCDSQDCALWPVRPRSAAKPDENGAA
jgi:hypothetical protein